MSRNPVSAPPRWAKCAMPVETPPIPKNNSAAAIIGTKYFAFRAMGGKSNRISTFGKCSAKATMMPKTAPDAPNIAPFQVVGSMRICCNSYHCIPVCATQAPRPQDK